jgi:hypothetical protein
MIIRSTDETDTHNLAPVVAVDPSGADSPTAGRVVCR